jgi:NAD(P)H-hydrate repair Nnr-like enzyme with NAD(P)H-hydrate dehydratase domain
MALETIKVVRSNSHAYKWVVSSWKGDTETVLVIGGAERTADAAYMKAAAWTRDNLGWEGSTLLDPGEIDE